MSRAPWVAHFGLDRTPFGKSIAAKDLFIRQAHQEAVARINFCIVESAIGVVTGDVGAGKTVSVRAAVSSLDPTRHQVIYIANPAFGTRGLYVTIVRSLGAEPRYLKAELMVQAADLLAAEAAERHRRVVLIVDEAHLLSLPSSKSSDCSRTPRWTRLSPSPASWSASRRSTVSCAWGSSPPWTRGSLRAFP